jgi:hypothetical protein
MEVKTAALIVAAVRPLVLEEAAQAVKAECSHGDMHYGDFDPERCPICTHFAAAVRALAGETQA